MSIAGVITPYAHGLLSNDCYLASTAYVPDRNKPAFTYLMLCMSIELALKAAILSEDCTTARKAEVKALGHDLLAVIARCEQSFDLSFLDAQDRQAIAEVNPYFRTKGLEYFTIDMMESMLSGGAGLPDLGALQAAADKVNRFLNDNALFIEGKTSEKPSGFMTFY